MPATHRLCVAVHILFLMGFQQLLQTGSGSGGPSGCCGVNCKEDPTLTGSAPVRTLWCMCKGNPKLLALLIALHCPCINVLVSGRELSRTAGENQIKHSPSKQFWWLPQLRPRSRHPCPFHIQFRASPIQCSLSSACIPGNPRRQGTAPHTSEQQAEQQERGGEKVRETGAPKTLAGSSDLVLHALASRVT